jgi:hypothetical protein
LCEKKIKIYNKDSSFPDENLAVVEGGNTETGFYPPSKDYLFLQSVNVRSAKPYFFIKTFCDKKCFEIKEKLGNFKI